ncbi:MAG: acetylxylan esterase [Chloroflexi bacterium]|nr:acetylxylan esterase [Chloroflexota bacterium]
MPHLDLAPEQLRTYVPDLSVPADLETFWTETLAETRAWPLDVTFVPVPTPIRLIETFDVTFRGFGGTPIRGWLAMPRGAAGPLPGVVQYVGYGGGRGHPHEHLLWAAAGYAHLVMDTRGQGANGLRGDTADPDASGQPRVDGLLTDGILSPETYYYRRVMADAVRAVEALRAHPRVDGTRIAVTGVSQGGGLSLATAALVPNLVGVMADVPFLSDFPRAIRIADTDPYLQIARYLAVHRDRIVQVEQTLAYFDVAVLGRWATAPALFSVAFMDRTCPPSTVYAAYHHYAGPKDIREYPFNDHEGGQQVQEIHRIDWLDAQLGRSDDRLA